MNTMEEVDIPVPTEEDAPEAQLVPFMKAFSSTSSGQLWIYSLKIWIWQEVLVLLLEMELWPPGGDDAPSGDGWCLDINPGDQFGTYARECHPLGEFIFTRLSHECWHSR